EHEPRQRGRGIAALVRIEPGRLDAFDPEDRAERVVHGGPHPSPLLLLAGRLTGPERLDEQQQPGARPAQRRQAGGIARNGGSRELMEAAAVDQHAEPAVPVAWWRRADVERVELETARCLAKAA